MKKSNLRLISLLISLIMFIQFFPTKALATQISDNDYLNESITEGSDTYESSEEESSILSEIESERTEDSKTFLLSDGSYTVANYSLPVHYRDSSGSWKDYDNTLVGAGEADTKGGYQVYSTKSRDVNISVASEIKQGETVSIDSPKYPLSWGLNAAEKSSISIDDENTEKSVNENYVVLEKTSQKAEYRSVYDGVDVQYVIGSVGIKENIILNNRNARTEFDITYNIGTLEAVQIDDKTIALKSEDETVYLITAPFMSDASGEYGYKLSLKINEKGNGRLTVRLSADREWILDAERAFPVTIDPIIYTDTTRSAIDSAFVTSGMSGTNHNDKAEMILGRETSQYGNCRVLMKFALDDLNLGDMVVDAKLNFLVIDVDRFTSSTPDLQADAHIITSSWSNSTVTWSNKPSIDSTVLDYQYIDSTSGSSVKQYSFDITEAVKGWYEGSSNYGVMLKSANEGGSDADVGVKASLYSERYTVSDAFPYLTITYRNNKGLEDYWTYTSLSAGTAGNIYVNDYTGNLVVKRCDVGTTGEILPISIEHVYNNYMAGQKYSDNVASGRGWKLNIQQTVKSSSVYGLTGTSLTNFPYAYEDGDGTVHFFYKQVKNGTTKYIDEDGLNLELKILSSGYSITDKEDNVLTFNSGGNLTKISDASSNEITITYSGGQITKVTDGVGHELTFTYNDSGYIRSITDPGGRTTTYYYDGGYLDRVYHADGTRTYYNYSTASSSGKRFMTHAISSDNSALAFSYTSEARGKQVSTITEKIMSNREETGTSGQSVQFDRSKYNVTTLRTSGSDDVFNNDDDIITTYQFDNYGRTVMVSNKKANGLKLDSAVYNYTQGTGEVASIGKLNRLSSEASAGRNNRNYVNNSSAETSGSWTNSRWRSTVAVYTNSVSTDEAYVGAKSFKTEMTSVVGNGGAGRYQEFSSSVLVPGSTYTFSAYVKTSNLVPVSSSVSYGAAIGLRFEKSDGTIIRELSELVQDSSIYEAENGWGRVHITYTIPDDTVTSQMYLIIKSATGSAYFDGVQVEKSSRINDYNMLEDGDFEDGSAQWYGTNLTTSTDKLDTSQHNSGARSFKITGSPSTKKNVGQIVYVEGNRKDIYIVSGWAKANAVQGIENTEREFDIVAKIYYTDGTTYTKSENAARFNRSVSEWQYSSAVFDLSKPGDSSAVPERIKVSLRYYNQENTVYFDNIQLIKATSDSYTYDSEGNLITSVENGENNSAMTYDEDSNLTAFTDDKNNNYTYTYKATSGSNTNSHLIEKANSTSTGISFNYNYYSTGKVASVEIRNSSGSMVLRNGISYTEADTATGVSAGAYVEYISDYNGNRIEYDYDKTTGVLNSVEDQEGNITSYTHDVDNDLLSSVSSGGSTVNYGYDSSKTRLASITHNGFSYNFTYDSFGNVVSTKVGSQILSTNTYNSGNGKLAETTYGNGFTKTYDYGDFSLPTILKYNGSTKFSWGYNARRQITLHTDYVNGLRHNYNYDTTGRLISHTAFDSTETSMDADKKVYKEIYDYDTMNNLRSILHTTGGRTVTNRYTYGDDNRVTKYVGTRVSVDYAYDTLGRLNNKTIKSTDTTNPTDIVIDYRYKLSSGRNIGDTETYRSTQLNYEMLNGDADYQYNYDNNGNITEIKEKNSEGTYVLKVSYEYDSKNQLTRENNSYLNQTITYSYDGGGNITSKKVYSYTTGTLTGLTPTEEANYSYTDSIWKDKLTQYTKGNTTYSITYDQIGNPTSYMGMTMTWQGRELSSVTNNGTSISYKYDADGLRLKKTVGNVSYEYQYLDGKLFYEKCGSRELYFFYDTTGALTAIRRYDNGTYSAHYYVVSNSRGDVELIYNKSNGLLARYYYDAWGNAIDIKDASGNSITDSSHIANINPIRYRGYYFDAETGLYYVQSRYYNPEVGRFLNADDVISGTGESVQGYNLFAYCNNNPVNMSDETGNWPKWVKKVAIGTIAIAVGVLATVLTGGTAIPALIGSMKLAFAGVVIGSGVGAVKHLAKKKTVKGIGKGMLEDAATGYMVAGLVAGGMQVGRAVLTKAKSGIALGKKKATQLFYHTPKTNGGTIISIKKEIVDVQKTYRFRLDLDVVNGLHFHSGVGKASKAHHIIIPWIFK